MDTNPEDKHAERGDANLATQSGEVGEGEKGRESAEKRHQEVGPKRQGRTRGGLWLIAAGISFILVIAGIALACCSRTERLAMQPPGHAEFRYADLEASWNQFAAQYPAGFRLFGERGGSDANIIAALNHWLKAFARMPGQDYQDELAILRHDFGVTAFHVWEDFRRDHYRQRPLELNAGMEPAALCAALNNYIGVSKAQNPQDYISAETVRAIVYMNSLCAFFRGEMERLHRDGIDTEIYECEKLDPGANFPSLGAMTRK